MSFSSFHQCISIQCLSYLKLNMLMKATGIVSYTFFFKNMLLFVRLLAFTSIFFPFFSMFICYPFLSWKWGPLFSLRMNDACVSPCDTQLSGFPDGEPPRGADAVQKNLGSWFSGDTVTPLGLGSARNLSPLAPRWAAGTTVALPLSTQCCQGKGAEGKTFLFPVSLFNDISRNIFFFS